MHLSQRFFVLILEDKGEKLIIDLSVPYNVEQPHSNCLTITLVNVDELSKLKDETLAKRQAEVPKAKAIIAQTYCRIL